MATHASTYGPVSKTVTCYLKSAISRNVTSHIAMVIVNTATTGVDWETAIRKARTAGLKVLAFGSHMDLEARSKALEAGAQRVVANSKFTSDMPGLVKRMLDEPDASSLHETDSEPESAI